MLNKKNSNMDYGKWNNSISYITYRFLQSRSRNEYYRNVFKFPWMLYLNARLFVCCNWFLEYNWWDPSYGSVLQIVCNTYLRSQSTAIIFQTCVFSFQIVSIDIGWKVETKNIILFSTLLYQLTHKSVSLIFSVSVLPPAVGMLINFSIDIFCTDSGNVLLNKKTTIPFIPRI
jgi:hypothetical protein